MDHIKDLTILLLDLGGKTSMSRNVAHEIVKAYESSGRYYHNLKHIDQCLKMFAISQIDSKYSKSLSRSPDDMRAVELALWYHDSIYDHTRHDNEEMSAALLLDSANQCGISSSVIEVARNAILATKHQIIPTSNIDKWVVDIDLSILSSPEEEFDEYEKNVRREFSHIDDLNWVTGRTNFLSKMLDRGWIYSTPDFRRLHEGDARKNIKRSIERLDKGMILI